MNNTRNKSLWIILSLVLLVFAVFIVGRLGGSNAVNPNSDSSLSAEEGRDFAALYKHGQLFSAVSANEEIMSRVRSDLMTFAKITRSEFSDNRSLVGFTFNNKVEKDGDTYVFTGYYFGVRDPIEVRLTSRGKGVYTLSITNLSDQTNIDDFLTMNGPRNTFIARLPIEEGVYSIRYLNTSDKIVVSFDSNYTQIDLNRVEKLLVEGLGRSYDEDVEFNLNRVGSMTLDDLRDNLYNPVTIPLR